MMRMPAVAHQRPARLDLADADIEAGLLQQFAIDAGVLGAALI
jgi:hypothetical protein